MAGFVYFGRLREAGELLKEIRSKPGEFFGRFYEEQLSKDLIALTSEYPIKRATAIRNLAANPTVAEGNFDAFVDAFRAELGTEKFRGLMSMFNLGALSELMFRHRPEKARAIVLEEIRKRDKDFLRVNALITTYQSYMPSDDPSEMRSFLSSDMYALRRAALQAICLFGGMRDEFLIDIGSHASGDEFELLFTSAKMGQLHVNERVLVQGIMAREHVEYRAVEAILSNLSADALSMKDRTDLVLKALGSPQPQMKQSTLFYQMNSSLDWVFEDPRLTVADSKYLLGKLRAQGITDAVLGGL